MTVCPIGSDAISSAKAKASAQPKSQTGMSRIIRCDAMIDVPGKTFIGIFLPHARQIRVMLCSFFFISGSWSVFGETLSGSE